MRSYTPLKSFAIYSLLAFLAIFQSCEKTEETAVVESGPATVTVSLAGVEFDDEGDVTPSAKTSSGLAQGRMSTSNTTVANEDEPFAVVPFDDNILISATLKEESTGSTARKLTSSSNKGAIVREPLATGTRYRLLVFGPTGAYVTQRDYTYGSEGSTAALNLDGGTSYTFVAYSFDNATTIPALNLTTSSTLANTSLTGLTGDFLYFKNTIQVSTGTNNLSIVLKHMFSEITTVLTVGTTVGNIEGFTTPRISRTRPSANIALATNTMTYADSTSAGTAVSFPAVNTGAKTTTSAPLIFISPAITNASFNFGTLTINGITRSNVSIPNVKINPGRKYTLTLSFNSPCLTSTLISNSSTNSTSPNFDLQNGNGVTFRTQVVTNTSFQQEFVLDFFALDNSFNLLFNGSDVVSNTTTPTELQFQSNLSNLPRNMQFADGTFWGAGGIPEIWNLQVASPSNNPIIRVVIDSNGDVTMYGIKASGGQLFPLRLTSGANFRRIAWRTGSTTNAIVLGQSNANPPTVMRGVVSARRNCS